MSRVDRCLLLLLRRCPLRRLLLVWSAVMVTMIYIIVVLLVNLWADRARRPTAKEEYSSGMGATYRKRCSVVDERHRIGCHPEPGLTRSSCRRRGCCYSPGSPVDVPACYFPLVYDGYKVYDLEYDAPECSVCLLLRRARASGFPDDVGYVSVNVSYYSAMVARITISSSAKDPNGVDVPAVPFAKVSGSHLYGVYVSDIGDVVIYRKANGRILFETDLSQLVYARKFVQIAARVPTSDLYGLGATKGPLRRRGPRRYTLINKDPKLAEETALRSNSELVFGSHPFYVAIEPDGSGHGVFLRSSSILQVETLQAPAVVFRTMGGPLDLFVFAGPTPAKVVRQYQALVGLPAMPPYWALGFHFTTHDLRDSRERLDRMYAQGLYPDAVWLDRHAMAEGCDFVYSKATEDKLREMVFESPQGIGLHYVVVMGPTVHAKNACSTANGMALHALYWRAVVTASDGTPVKVQMYGNTTRLLLDYTSPTITRFLERAVTSQQKMYPFSGAWLEDNEPTVPASDRCGTRVLDASSTLMLGAASLVEGTPCMSDRHAAGPHYLVRNAYAYHQAAAVHNTVVKLAKERPLIVSGATFSGVGKYAGHALAGTKPSWENLRMSIPMMLTMSLLGVPLTGTDACGKDDAVTKASQELCARWFALAAFYPLHHARSYPDSDRDPTSFSKGVVKDARAAASLRRTLLPYLYYLFYKSHTAGDTVARPLFLEFPDLREVQDMDRQFLWGSALMILPILYPGIPSYEAYVPPGRWYRYHTGEAIESNGSYHTFSAVLQPINLLIRGGYVVPTQRFVDTAMRRFSTLPSCTALLLTALVLTSPACRAAGVIEWAAQASDLLSPLRSVWKRASLRDSPVFYVSTFLRPRQPTKSGDIFSPLFKLPIQFMSNARPLDIVKGLRKPALTKPKKNFYQNSKMLLLPIKFLANGKPNRRVVVKPRSSYFFRR